MPGNALIPVKDRFSKIGAISPRFLLVVSILCRNVVLRQSHAFKPLSALLGCERAKPPGGVSGLGYRTIDISPTYILLDTAWWNGYSSKIKPRQPASAQASQLGRDVYRATRDERNVPFCETNPIAFRGILRCKISKRGSYSES